jgi:6,7-dimethyl-8-ribityllumazine synthase
MTSNDVSALPAGALEELAGQVGVQLVGATDGSGLRIGIAAARFNGGITQRLIGGALDGLAACSVERTDVALAWVPGAFELPLLAQHLASFGSIAAVICLGAVIRGETGHYDFVAGQCAAGIQRVQLDTGVPIVFGVLTTENLEQALARSLPDETNRGREAALTAIEMVRLLADDAPLVRSGR